MSEQKNFKLDSINASASQSYKKHTESTSSSFLSIILIIFTVIFIVSYVRSLFGAGDITFTSFLDFIQSVPEVSFASTFIDLTILGDWGIFEFLRNFLNIFTNIFSVLIFLFGGLVQILLYAVYIVRYLFLI